MNKEQYDEIVNTPGFEQIRKILVKNFHYQMVKPNKSTMKDQTIQIIRELQKEGYTIHEFKTKDIKEYNT